MARFDILVIGSDGDPMEPNGTQWRGNVCAYLDALIPKRIFVAVGGCGSAAKSSDAIGEEAAGLVVGERLANPAFVAQWV